MKTEEEIRHFLAFVEKEGLGSSVNEFTQLSTARKILKWILDENEQKERSG